MVAMAGLHHVWAARLRLGWWILHGDGHRIARRRLRRLVVRLGWPLPVVRPILVAAGRGLRRPGGARGRFVGQKQLGHLVVLAARPATLWVAADRSGAAGVRPRRTRSSAARTVTRDGCRLAAGRR